MRTQRSRKPVAPAAAFLALALAGGVAYATIPDGSGTIHACYDTRSGAVRIFDPAGGQIKPCAKTEVETSWSQVGPQGASGPSGPQGETGPKGDPGELGLAGQACADGFFVTGFDASGDIVCGTATTPPPPPGPPPPPIDCNDGDPYTADFYDAGSQVCEHVPISADVDGDGHEAQQATGGSPDCDDTDPATYPGATELEDGKDNDCDGVVDG